MPFQPVVEFGQCVMLRGSTTAQLWCAVCHSIHACAVLDIFLPKAFRDTREYTFYSHTKRFSLYTAMHHGGSVDQTYK